MLTKITIRNFKTFGEVEIDLGNPVVFIGPNNSGKTSAMQALALWDIGLKRWNEKRSGKKSTPTKRPGVTVNRRDLVAIPVPDTNLLWHRLHMRDVQRGKDEDAGRIQKTSNVRIDIIVEGITEGRPWTCGLEFDYANSESLYCRPLRHDGELTPVPTETRALQIAFLPPMSGLAATETRLDDGAMNVRVGEGRTAEVLRNLCYQVQKNRPDKWAEITSKIMELFGVKLDDARYVPERGEITMIYREQDVKLDLSSSGRGLQQTLLLLAYMYANQGAVLLLDEPDAHLEILRQRQTYKLIADVASDSGSQIIAASHSEVLLNEAAGKDMVIAFVGKPHPIAERKSQLLKALKSIGFDQYFQAEQTGWVLYLEGSTDLAVLQAFASRLKYAAAIEVLRKPFVHYVGNQPPAVFQHYHGLREALPDLKGVAILDRVEVGVPEVGLVNFLTWNKREIENYLCSQATLEAYVQASSQVPDPGPLFLASKTQQRMKAMRESIDEVTRAMKTLGHGSPWDGDTKASDDFLVPLFHAYFKRLGLKDLMAKKSFYKLAEHVPESEIDPEIREKLDAIVQTAKAAKPRVE